MRRAIAGAFLTASVSCAFADEAEQAYQAGYQRGYEAGYAAGSAGTVMNRRFPAGPPGSVIWKQIEIDPSGPGTVMLPGQNFTATIDPARPDASFSFKPDSSVAIIPRSAVDEIKQKMGADFVQKNMILNNNAGVQ